MVEVRQRRVLCVDDDAENLNLLKQALERESYIVETANSGAKALEHINHWHPDLVLLDRNMPGLSGIEILRQLRQKTNYVGVIFVSADTRPQLVVESLLAGADDYVRKPFSFTELIARIRVRFRFKDLQDELNQAIYQLKEQADRDHLTGLFNMRSIYGKIDHELKRIKRYGGQVGCIMMDMDHFKKVNDEHDHLFGSFVLKEVGQIIKKSVRETDFAARYGGDEFLIVTLETNDEGIRIFCERLRKTIESTLFKSGNDEIRLTTSLGYSLTSPQQEIDARTLVRAADRALYQAKAKGRNQFVGAVGPNFK